MEAIMIDRTATAAAEIATRGWLGQLAEAEHDDGVRFLLVLAFRLQSQDTH
jgi:hypothetical protein